ncbi:unnamed protein product [Calypogeia fissa]
MDGVPQFGISGFPLSGRCSVQGLGFNVALLCATQPFPSGGRMLSPTSHLTSSRSHQYLLNLGGRGLSPYYSFSRLSSSLSSSCLGSPPLKSFPAQQDDQPQERNLVVASLKPASGKGFGKKNVVENKTTTTESSEDTSGSSLSPPALEDAPSKPFRYRRGEEEEDEGVPEVVTNRMLKRIAFTVGLPLVFGLLLFPLFYYLKVVSKLDVPEWLPLIVSMVTFGTAGFGITYGVVSSSWDPAREGSLLGWKEAQVNWPLIWDKFPGNKKK